ncbi:MAG: preprotein translocase subunit YajC [Pseudonocardiales bacterium]|nr:preprotein translocase subunit YajC [Pseudonocardiales bacterium]MBV9029984.1 preprotein translocase subunit YajC [Pseudonocardiales bacterium]MBW0010941.1 preprotein translocase subunit YajC [Pseudonocardiales bacterium]
MNPQFLSLLLIAMLALLLMMNSRRQKRAVADARQLQSSLTNGDRVVTTSGLHGTVVGSAEETTVDLEIAPGVRTRWLRAAIREKITEDEESAEDNADPAAAGAPLPAPLDGSARADKS